MAEQQQKRLQSMLTSIKQNPDLSTKTIADYCMGALYFQIMHDIDHQYAPYRATINNQTTILYFQELVKFFNLHPHPLQSVKPSVISNQIVKLGTLSRMSCPPANAE